MHQPSTTVDEILDAADINEEGLGGSSTVVASGSIATNVDVGSIRLEDILNEQSDDDGDGNIGDAYGSIKKLPYVSPKHPNFENDSLINEARECVRNMSASPPTNRASPRTSEILQQILDEDETDDTDQFLEYLNSVHAPRTNNAQNKIADVANRKLDFL